MLLADLTSLAALRPPTRAETRIGEYLKTPGPSTVICTFEPSLMGRNIWATLERIVSIGSAGAPGWGLAESRSISIRALRFIVIAWADASSAAASVSLRIGASPTFKLRAAHGAAPIFGSAAASGGGTCGAICWINVL